MWHQTLKGWWFALETQKRIVYTLLSVLLALCCLFVGRLVFMPDQTARAAERRGSVKSGGVATITSWYQTDCLAFGNTRDTLGCVVTDPSTGEVVNIFSVPMKHGVAHGCVWVDDEKTCNDNLQR